MGFNSVLNKVFNFFILKRMKGIHYFMNHPFEVQNKVLFTLLEQAKNTEYGRLSILPNLLELPMLKVNLSQFLTKAFKIAIIRQEKTLLRFMLTIIEIVIYSNSKI